MNIMQVPICMQIFRTECRREKPETKLLKIVDVPKMQFSVKEIILCKQENYDKLQVDMKRKVMKSSMLILFNIE